MKGKAGWEGRGDGQLYVERGCLYCTFRFTANFPHLLIERGFRQRQKLINDGLTLDKKITPEETEDKVV